MYCPGRLPKRCYNTANMSARKQCGEAVNAPYLQRVLNVIVILRQMRVEVHLAVAVTASSPTCCYFGGGGAGSGACLAPSYADEQAQRSGA